MYIYFFTSFSRIAFFPTDSFSSSSSSSYIYVAANMDAFSRVFARLMKFIISSGLILVGDSNRNSYFIRLIPAGRIVSSP